jgi:WD40 repeat protein
MAWPVSQDYNEAIQSPQQCFSDAELRAGQARCNALGLPLPRSGNFADVYEFECPATGSKWALKCFTRQIPKQRERYAEISKYLQQARLPFAVDFQYLDKGIQVRGQWYPILKMRWVEGLLLNEFARDNLDRRDRLQQLSQIWARMSRWLADAGMAHCDLQHGNVLLVPGSTANALAVKLIDYDGMFVPALSGTKSGEVGHPNFQHPERLREGTYSRDVDRFPLLVVATALRALVSGGRALWERYDNGDNLLFKESDLAAPDKSALFGELQRISDPLTQKLTNRLRQACQARLEETAALDQLLPKEWFAAPARTSGIKKGAAAAAVQGPDWDFDRDDPAGVVSRPVRRKAGGVPRWAWAVGGLTAVVLIAVVGIVLALALGKGSGGSSKAVAQGKKDKLRPGPEPIRPVVDPKDNPPPVDPPVGPPAVVGEKDPQPVVGPQPGQAPVLVKARTFPGRFGQLIQEHRAMWTWDGNQLTFYKLDTGEYVGRQPFPGVIFAVAPDHQHIFGVRQVGGKQSYEVWDRSTQAITTTLEGLKDLQQVRFFGQPARLLTSERRTVDGRFQFLLRPWDLATRTTIANPPLEPFAPNLDHLSLSADGKLALTGEVPGGLRMWELTTGKTLRLLLDLPGGPGSERTKTAAFTPRGTRAVCNAWNSNVVTVRDVGGNREICRFVEAGPLPLARLSADGRRVLTQVPGQSPRIWDADTGQELARLEMPNGRLTSVQFSPNGQYVFTPIECNADHLILAWQLPAPGASSPPKEPPPALTQLTLTNGQAVVNAALTDKDAKDSLRQGSYCKVYSVPMIAGRRYRAEMECKATAPCLRLETPDGRPLRENNGLPLARVSFFCTRSGTYRLSATTNLAGATGEFTLRVQAEPMRPPGTGNAVVTELKLDRGKAVAKAALTPADARDAVRQGAYCKVYSLPMEAGKKYQIDMVSKAIDPFLRLEGPGGLRLAEDDDSGGGLNARIVFNCTKTGTYRIICTTFAERILGEFTLTVQTAARGAVPAVALDLDLTPAFPQKLTLPFDFKAQAQGPMIRSGVNIAKPQKTSIVEEPSWRQQARTPVEAIAIHPNGKNFLYGDGDGVIHLADLATGKTVRELRGHTGPVRALVVSADGTRALSGSEDQTARLWDLKTGEVLQELKPHAGAVVGADLSRDGKYALTHYFVIRDDPGHVKVWDTATGKLVAAQRGTDNSAIRAALFYPDSQHVLLARGKRGQQVVLNLWEPLTKARREILILDTKQGFNREPIGRLVLSADGERLLFYCHNAVWLAMTRSGKVLEKIDVENTNGAAVDLRADGLFCLASGGGKKNWVDNCIHVVSLKKGRELSRLNMLNSAFRGGLFTPDGRQVLTRNIFNQLMLWDLPDVPAVAANEAPRKCLRFRKRAYVELARTQTMLDLNGTFTAELWARLRPGTQYLVGDESWKTVGAPVNRSAGWVLRAGAAQGNKESYSLNVACGQDDWFTVSGEPLTPSTEWQHIAVVKTPREARLYLNGKLYARRSSQGQTFVPCPSNLFLGVRKNAYTNRTVDADIGAFRISRTAVYQEEFSPPTMFGKTPDTLVLLDISAVRGNNIPDRSGHGHDGTIVGAELADWQNNADTPASSVAQTRPRP